MNPGFVLTIVVAMVTITIAEGGVAGDGAVSEKLFPGFTKIGQWTDPNHRIKTYYISDGTATQPVAQGHCVNTFGGNLVTILNRAEFDTVVAHVQEHNVLDTNLWTAGKYYDSTKWVWLTTGNVIESSQLFWYTGQPSGTSSSRAITLLVNNLEQGYYAGYTYNTTLRYICEV